MFDSLTSKAIYLFSFLAFAFFVWLSTVATGLEAPWYAIFILVLAGVGWLPAFYEEALKLGFLIFAIKPDKRVNPLIAATSR